MEAPNAKKMGLIRSFLLASKFRALVRSVPRLGDGDFLVSGVHEVLRDLGSLSRTRLAVHNDDLPLLDGL